MSDEGRTAPGSIPMKRELLHCQSIFDISRHRPALHDAVRQSKSLRPSGTLRRKHFVACLQIQLKAGRR
jgi:hypothetical protein